MTAPKSTRRGYISSWDFMSLRSQLRGERLHKLVDAIETEFRKALRIEAFFDDNVVAALLDAGNRAAAKRAGRAVDEQSEADRAGLTVIRMCMGFREALDDADRDDWLDRIGLALADADPARLEGLKTRAERRAGTARSAESRAPEKHHAETLSKIRAMLAAGKKPNAKELVAKGCSLSTVYKLIAQVNRELSAE